MIKDTETLFISKITAKIYLSGLCNLILSLSSCLFYENSLGEKKVKYLVLLQKPKTGLGF